MYYLSMRNATKIGDPLAIHKTYRNKSLSNIRVDCTYDMLVMIESLDVVLFSVTL
jgi:hypothetical protein